MMCSKQSPYFTKWIIGFVILMIGVIIIMSVYFSSGGDAAATIEMNGEDNNSVVQQDKAGVVRYVENIVYKVTTLVNL